MIPFLKRKQYRHLNTLSISASAIAYNYQSVLAKHPEARVAPVLKSNAYGHGLTMMAPVFDSLHPPFLCVDSLYEAYELMKLRIKTPVFIMGYTKPENFSVKRLPFEFSVFDADVVEALSRHQPGANVHIKIDTGMSRYGVQMKDLRSFVRFVASKNLNITGLWSHFADADNPTSTRMMKKQILVYKEGLNIITGEGIVPRWRHISASAGAFKVFDDTFTMIRTGIALYGISPLAQSDVAYGKISLKPAAALTSTITQVKTVEKGDTVGYNATFTVKKHMKIAVLPLGYFEGLDRRLSNCGVIEVNGNPCPIIGRVSMNITAIDVTSAGNVAVGDPCIVYSSDTHSYASIAEQAKKANMIPYDILVHLNSSIYREVID
jgi:alanine racemase